MNTHHFRLAVFLPMLLALAGCNLFEELMEEMEKQQALEKNCTNETYNGTAYSGHVFNSKLEGWCEVSGDILEYSNGKGTEIDFVVTKTPGAQTYEYTSLAPRKYRKTDNAVVTVSPDGKKWTVIYSSNSVAQIKANPTFYTKEVFTFH